MTLARRRRLRRLWNSLTLAALPGALLVAFALGALVAALTRGELTP